MGQILPRSIERNVCLVGNGTINL